MPFGDPAGYLPRVKRARRKFPSPGGNQQQKGGSPPFRQPGTPPRPVVGGAVKPKVPALGGDPSYEARSKRLPKDILRSRLERKRAGQADAKAQGDQNGSLKRRKQMEDAQRKLEKMRNGR
jgi:hypothetical protein